MAQDNHNTTLPEILQELSGAENPLLPLMLWLCRQSMSPGCRKRPSGAFVAELEVTQQLNAEKSERVDGRSGYRSGYRPRQFDTRLGTLNLLALRPS